MILSNNRWYFWTKVLPIFFFACSVSSRLQKDKESSGDSNSKLLISIQQGFCKGKCPVYEANFYTGKKMIYEGRSRMPLLGKYQYLVPDELTKNLIFEAVKLNLKILPDSSEIPEGAQKIRVRLVINGNLKHIVRSTANQEENFSKFVRLLFSDVNAMITEQEGVKLP
jgi:hypothetical protein